MSRLVEITHDQNWTEQEEGLWEENQGVAGEEILVAIVVDTKMGLHIQRVAVVLRRIHLSAMADSKRNSIER